MPGPKAGAKRKNQVSWRTDKCRAERWDIQLDEGVLGEVKQRNLSAWRQKVGEREKKKSGIMEKRKTKLTRRRAALETQARGRHACKTHCQLYPGGVCTGPTMSRLGVISTCGEDPWTEFKKKCQAKSYCQDFSSFLKSVPQNHILALQRTPKKNDLPHPLIYKWGRRFSFWFPWWQPFYKGRGRGVWALHPTAVWRVCVSKAAGTCHTLKATAFLHGWRIDRWA